MQSDFVIFGFRFGMRRINSLHRHFVFGLVKLQGTPAFGTMTRGKPARLRDTALPGKDETVRLRVFANVFFKWLRSILSSWRIKWHTPYFQHSFQLAAQVGRHSFIQ
jgi:hypothetical protein